MAERSITGGGKAAVLRPRAMPTYESDHVSWLATLRQEPQEHTPGHAHRYLADGRIELICLACLRPICVVRDSQHADAGLSGHICSVPASSRREESKAWLRSLRRVWLSFWRGGSRRNLFVRLLRES